MYIYPPIFPHDPSTDTDGRSRTRERVLHPVYACLRIRTSGEHRRRLTPEWSRDVGRYEMHREPYAAFRTGKPFIRDTHNVESPLSLPGDVPGIPSSAANGRFNLLMVVAPDRVGPISSRISPTLTWIARRRSDRPRNPRVARLTPESLHIGLAGSRTNSVLLSRFHAR